MSPTMSTTTNRGSAQTGQSPCGCPEVTPSQPCCCNLVCFERPNYFCGHLLTDADLTLQQKYVVEKNKLYHRTMDGYGVVCGLKLTCDCDCKGNILIHDGFAIDDCGNDLVVCETARFDVIAALKQKGLLVYDPPEDDCEPHRRRSRCDIKQCFYITICYNETESDYETPFQSSCTSGPKECMPTRTHEGVRFDVTDKLPPSHSQCEELIERIRECFELNCDSQVASIMRRYKKELLWIFGEGKRKEIEPWQEPCELFCTIRAYFLNYLKVNPDRFNCNLYEEVSCLICPGEHYDEDERENRHHSDRDEREGRRERERELGREKKEEQRREREEEEWRDYDRKELQEAFRKLLYYMQRYQYDCVLGDVVFNCQQPCEAHCLVLGTVEVVNGKLIRVCNTPRKYLMAPANLLNVLIYDIMTQQLHPHEGCRDKDDNKIPCCCPDYDKFRPEHFLTEFGVDQCGRYEAATSAIRALCALPRSLHHAFDYTDSMAISPTVLAKIGREEAEAIKSRFGISRLEQPLPEGGFNPLTPMQTVQSHMLLRRNDAVVAYYNPEDKDGAAKVVNPSFWAAVDPDREIGTSIQQQAAIRYDQQIRELKKEVEDLRATVAELRKPSKKGGSKDE